MNIISTLAEEGEPKSGRFIDVTESLLPLFSDPDARAGRRWREMFGMERPAPPSLGGIHFTVRARRKSSSDC